MQGGCKQRANSAIWRIMCPLRFAKQRKNQHAGCYQKWLWYRRPSDLWCLSPRYLKPSQPMAWVCVAAPHHFKPCAVFHHLPTIVSGSERSGLCTLLWRSPTEWRVSYAVRSAPNAASFFWEEHGGRPLTLRILGEPLIRFQCWWRVSVFFFFFYFLPKT